MTLFELIEHIQNLGCSEPNVRFVSLGDIYELNKRQDIDYPAFVVTQGINYGSTEEGTETYGITMFLVDRLTSDKSNEIDIQSWADTGLKNIISRIEEHNIGIIQGQYTVQTFTERFDSLCAGAFVLVNIKVDVLDCDSGTEKIRLVTSVNGQTGDVIVKGLEGAVVYSVNGQVGDVVLDIPDVTHFVTDSSVSDNYTKKSSLNNYLLKEEYVKPDVTKAYVDNNIKNVSNYVSDNYAKKSSLNNYLPKSEYIAPDVTKQYVDNNIKNVSNYVSNNYATKTSLNKYLLIADYIAPDVTKRYVDSNDLALSDKIYDLSTSLNRKINNVTNNIDDKIYDISVNLTRKVSDISNNIDDKISDLSEDIDNKFTELNIDIYNKFDILSDDIADLILEIDSKVENIQTDLNSKIENVSHETNSKISDLDNKINDLSNNISDISTNINSSLTEFNNKIINISTNIIQNISTLDSSIVNNYVNKTDFNNKLTDYYTKTEVNTKLNDYCLKSDVPSTDNFITNSSVEANYAKKTDIPTDFYSKSDIDNKLTNINSSISKIDSSVNYIQTYYITKEAADSIYTPYLTFALAFGGLSLGFESILSELQRQEKLISNINIDVVDISVNKIPGLQTNIDSKQEKLISGTTIKTINGESILGNGDIKVSVGDLTNYYTKTEINNKLNDYTLKSDIPDVLALDSSVKQLWNAEIENEIVTWDISTRLGSLFSYDKSTKTLDITTI